MIYVLLGKTCSGKTTVLKQLRELGHQTIVGYTTRPIRPGEVDGVHNNFVTSKQFKELGDNLIVKNSFKNAFGTVWHYGMHIKDIDPSIEQVIILEPKGYRELVETIGDHHVIGIYLDASLEVRLMRGLNREDNTGELMRRLQADEIDFLKFGREVDYVIDLVEKKAQLEAVIEIIERGEKK